jgi:hypothetical protein
MWPESGRRSTPQMDQAGSPPLPAVAQTADFRLMTKEIAFN